MKNRQQCAAIVALVFSIVALVLLMPGCVRRAEKHPAYCAVHGNVTYNGKAPTGAIVIFNPVPRDDDTAVTATPPKARVAADGTFHLAGNSDGGVVPGDYALTITWYPNAASSDRFRGQYNDPQSPILWLTIEKRENQVPPIELTGPPVNVDDLMGTDE